MNQITFTCLIILLLTLPSLFKICLNDEYNSCNICILFVYKAWQWFTSQNCISIISPSVVKYVLLSLIALNLQCRLSGTFRALTRMTSESPTSESSYTSVQRCEKRAGGWRIAWRVRTRSKILFLCTGTQNSFGFKSRIRHHFIIDGQNL